MATGMTAGVKRSRSDVPVYCAHLAQKRSRSMSAGAVDIPSLLKSDVGGFNRFDGRLATLNGLGMEPVHVTSLLRLVSGDANALLALVDLNGYQANVQGVLADFALRGSSITTLNLSSHAFCMADKFQVARAFISANEAHVTACEVLKYVVQHVFAQENSVAIRVLSGSGVRDVLLSDWCRQYKFCAAPEQTPNLVFVTAESGRIFLLPFST